MPDNLPGLDKALAQASKEELNFNHLLVEIDDPKYAVAKRQGFKRAMLWANEERRRIGQLEHELRLVSNEKQQHRLMAGAFWRAGTGLLIEADIQDLPVPDDVREMLLKLAGIHANHLALLDMLGPTEKTA